MYTAKSGASNGAKRERKHTLNLPKWAKAFWRVYFILFGLVCLMFLFISLGWMGYMPSFAELEDPDSNLATEVISSDGRKVVKTGDVKDSTTEIVAGLFLAAAAAIAVMKIRRKEQES